VLRLRVDRADAADAQRRGAVHSGAERVVYPPAGESEIDPLSIKGRAFEEKILWRRHDAENVPKLVEVKQCLTDDSDGNWEYILTDMTHTREWRYHEEDLADCFWDTGLYNDEHAKPVHDKRIREVWGA